MRNFQLLLSVLLLDQNVAHSLLFKFFYCVQRSQRLKEPRAPWTSEKVCVSENRQSVTSLLTSYNTFENYDLVTKSFRQLSSEDIYIFCYTCIRGTILRPIYPVLSMFIPNSGGTTRKSVEDCCFNVVLTMQLPYLINSINRAIWISRC